MKKLIFLLLLICSTAFTAFADEIITGFEAQDLPVLNEELRKISQDARSTRTYIIGHTYAIPGEIKVPSGDTDFICPFFIHVPAGDEYVIVKTTYKINSGTSVTAKLQKNGSDITGYTGISITTTTASTTVSSTLADGDKIALVVTAVSGIPKNMSFTIFIEYST